MISATNISKSYGEVKAVQDISFSINEGEITGFLGPNGAGKTTTLRMLTSYFQPDQGIVSVCGIDAAEDQIGLKKIIGYLPESAPLYEEMLVYDYLEFSAEIHSAVVSRIEEVSRMCGIVDVMHRPISELSKGYRQRVGLAAALIHDPKVLILDEPTTGLDPNQIIEIRKLIKTIGKDKTIILSTHILSEVEATCDRAIIINNGKIVADDSTENLKAGNSSDQHIDITVQGTEFESLEREMLKLESVKSLEKRDMVDSHISATVLAQDQSDIRPVIFDCIVRNNWILIEMSKQEQSLEHIFRSLTAGGDNA